ncbi:MAG: asparagine synthase (glutamine-hydrolyzing) [Leptospirillia bacterium]
MCGIIGICQPRDAVDPAQLKAAANRLRHRGPDANGLWFSTDRRVGLAHRRLAVIDLSPLGEQPMVSDDKRLALTYNGEIYNFQELRVELAGLGHTFRSRADSEVVLAAYREWGDQCVTRLNGMFAFAVYDQGNGLTPPSLFLARDRAGEKPLYYTHDRAGFRFASELKALPDISRDFDLHALNHYLALGYVPGERCIIQGVRKLPPAHVARLDLSDFSLSIRRYWQPPENRPDADIDPETLLNDVERLLQDAVRTRLVSDVPLGVLLSGGLDSSLVVAMAAQAQGKPVKTFTIANPGTPYDESHHARVVAEHFGTEHHELAVDAGALDTLDDIAPFVDEPLADSSLLPTFIVSKLVRSHVTVALGGDGGDELFGGYATYRNALRDQARMRFLPGPFLRLVARMAAMLPAGIRGRNRAASLYGGPRHQTAWGTPFFGMGLRQRLLHPDCLAELGPDLFAPERGIASLIDTGRDIVDGMTRADFSTTLADDFLVKIDRASMAHSLEMRVPFLDHHLIEYCFGAVPSHWKVSGGEYRRLEMRIAQKWLPKTLDLNRKQGFSIPMDDWLRADRGRRAIAATPRLSPWLRPGAVERLIDGHMSGYRNGARLYSLIILGLAEQNLGAV